MSTQLNSRLAERAREPRYTFARAAALVQRRPDAVRRWSTGNRRKYKGTDQFDQPLFDLDGSRESGLPLSFLNLLELEMLSQHRKDAPLQAIRPALDFAAKQLGEPRPLLTVEFKVHGGELFTQFALSPEGQKLIVNATRGGQTAMAEVVDAVTMQIDYDAQTAHRWWPLSKDKPVMVDTRVSAGQPVTAETGVRVDAIASRHENEDMSPEMISDDTGASLDEVSAALELVAA